MLVASTNDLNALEGHFGAGHSNNICDRCRLCRNQFWVNTLQLVPTASCAEYQNVPNATTIILVVEGYEVQLAVLHKHTSA